MSTDEQAERQTIENQIKACRDYCQQQGRTIVAEFRDEGVSGAKPLDERPEGGKLLLAAEDKHRQFDAVLVYRLDRLGRNELQCLLAIERLKRRGVEVLSVNESFDDTPAGEFHRNVMLAVGQLERDLIRERTSEGRRRKVRDGEYQAPVRPYGYRYNAETKRLDIDPVTGPVVQQIFRWCVEENLGLKAIVGRLDAAGIPPSRRTSNDGEARWGWQFTSVYKILTNRRYTGENTYAGIPMRLPALVDEETFARAQVALRRRQENAMRNTTHFYLLQHLLYCRACGHRYMVETKRSPVPARSFYVCYQRRVYGQKAGAVHEGVKWRWKADELEDLVKEGVKRILFDPEYYLPNLEVEVERIRADVAGAPERLADLRAKLADLDGREARIVEWGERGIITEAVMIQRLDDLKAEWFAMNNALKAAQREAVNAVDMVESAEMFLAMARDMGVTGGFIDEETGEAAEPTPEEWRGHIERVAQRIWVENDGSITIEGPGGVSVFPSSARQVISYTVRYPVRRISQFIEVSR